MQVIKILFVTVFLVGCVRTSVLPVEPCKLDDTVCMEAAFQKAIPTFIGGMPELGVENMDPMVMDDLDFDLSGLQFTMREGRFKGLKSAIIDKVKWDSKKSKITIEYHLNGTTKGHYTAAGRLLILPITGDGQIKLKFRNMSIRMFIDYKIVKGADGKDHVAPTKLDFDFDIKDNAHFNLTNLFNGNKELSETMLNFLNQNWKQVSAEFGRPMVQVAANKVFKNVGIFFSKVPLEDIALV